MRLRNRIDSSGMGPGVIGWSDLDAFVRLSGVRLAPWEIEQIEHLDDCWRAAKQPPKRMPDQQR